MTDPTAYLIDLPTSDDRLEFAPYVDVLAEILCDPATRTPFTIGLFGSWGTGKTSLMMMLRERMRGTSVPCRALWFDAWKYNQEEALWRALLLLLLDDLERLIEEDPPQPREGEPAPEALLEMLREALYRDTSWRAGAKADVDWVQAGTAAAGLAFNLLVSFTGLNLVKGVVEEAQKGLGKGEPVSQAARLLQAFRREGIERYQAQIRSLEQFQRNYRRLVGMLLEKTDGPARRLVVFVDDLDRCLPDKTVQVLEAIKLFLDVPGCVFVLALDPEAIESAVQARYEGRIRAREYLEKIIQLPFILPPIEPEAIRSYVETLAPALPDARCAEVFAQGLPPNPRQVKRTLNIYLLLSRLVAQRRALSEAVTPLRLAKLVAIQHAHADLYQLLRLQPRYLPQLEAFYRAERDGGGQERLALPEALQRFQGIDALRRLLCLFEEEEARFDGLSPGQVRSYLTLTRRAVPLEAPAVEAVGLPVAPEMVHIPAGEFLMGTSEAQARELRSHLQWDGEKADCDAERPAHTVALEAFEIGRYPVTNAEYAAFVQASGHAPPSHWADGTFPEALADHPVVRVTWHDAVAYAGWLRAETGKPYRLPTEAEWEKAARGEDGRLWPWGNAWEPERANCKPDTAGSTTPVGEYAPRGNSPYGCADMAGNVWEWCSSRWGDEFESPSFRYPYQPGDGREVPEAEDLRVLRGGSYRSGPSEVRCAQRFGYQPGLSYHDIGFRVARDV
jgi:formylglycine-generating enzyme required for sulfatase activity